MKYLILLMLSISSLNLWAEGLKVVATTESLGMLARTVGAEQVNVKVLAAPDRDTHYLQAKPSMMRYLRSADLLLAVGAGLEIGWLPKAIEGAHNPTINAGQTAHFVATEQVSLIGAEATADRSQGDVHPEGNPHVNLDPARMASIAKALAQRLGKLDAANATAYQQRADAFAAQVAERVPAWREQVKNSQAAVLHHKDGNYLLAFLGVKVLGYIEPLPGIPPTASHLKQLLTKLATDNGVILRTEFQAPQGADFLSEKLGWPSHALPLEPEMGADAQAYFALIDAWVGALR